MVVSLWWQLVRHRPAVIAGRDGYQRCSAEVATARRYSYIGGFCDMWWIMRDGKVVLLTAREVAIARRIYLK